MLQEWTLAKITLAVAAATALCIATTVGARAEGVNPPASTGALTGSGVAFVSTAAPNPHGLTGAEHATYTQLVADADNFAASHGALNPGQPGCGIVDFAQGLSAYPAAQQATVFALRMAAVAACDVDEVRETVAACIRWRIHIPGIVRVNPALGIVGVEAWAWFDEILGSGYVDTRYVSAAAAPAVSHQLLLTQSSHTWPPIAPNTVGNGGWSSRGQGVAGGAWFNANGVGVLNRVDIDCDSAQAGTAIDPANPNGAERSAAASSIRAQFRKPHQYGGSLTDLANALTLLGRWIDPGGSYNQVTSSWTDYWWDFDGDGSAEIQRPFHYGGAGASFDSGTATTATIAAYTGDVTHTYDEHGLWPLEARIRFTFHHHGTATWVREEYEYTEVWTSELSVPDAEYAGWAWEPDWTLPSGSCPSRLGSSCTLVLDYEYWDDVQTGTNTVCTPILEDAIDPVTGDPIIDPVTGNPVQVPAVDPITGDPLEDCVDVPVYTYTHLGSLYYWHYTSRYTCDGYTVHGGGWDGYTSDRNSYIGSSSSHSCRDTHSDTQRHLVCVGEGVFTCSGDGYFISAPRGWLSFEVDRELYRDLGIESHLGATYTDGYPVRRVWPYLTD